MTVLYGTVEYFEREISDYLAKNKTSKLDDAISIIYSRLEKEIFTFLRDEKIQVQCMNNLSSAVSRLTEKGIRV